MKQYFLFALLLLCFSCASDHDPYLDPDIEEKEEKEEAEEIDSVALFKLACSKPVVTFIDDDTNDIPAIERYFNACNAADIKGGFAVLTLRFQLFPQMKDMLLGYKAQGFDCIIHGYNQEEYFRKNPTTGEPADYVRAEENFARGLREMEESGFKDFNFWCTPYGAYDPPLQEMAQRYGMNCLISSGGRSPNLNDGSSSRWALTRCSFNPDKDGSNYYLDLMKSVVDKTIETNGWMLITTHMAQDEWKESAQMVKFFSLVSYIKSKGVDIMPISKAWEFKKPIYDHYKK